jgi:hypothetical protein
VSLWSDRRLQGDEFEAVDVADGSFAALRQQELGAEKLPAKVASDRRWQMLCIERA